MKKPTILKTLSLGYFTLLAMSAALLAKLLPAIFSFFGEFKKGALLNTIAFWGVLLLTSATYGQIGTPFSARLDDGKGNKYLKVQGDVILIGNTIVNRANTAPTFSPAAGPQTGVTFTGTVTNLATLTAEANTPFNSSGDNNSYFIEYSNVDPAPGVFSSTSANLNINNSCKKIAFAGLYWSAIYPFERSTSSNAKYNGSRRIEDWKNIKFKVPGGTYQDLTADKVIFDGYNYTNVQNSFKDSPYVCFKDVTTTLQALANADGTYTVANVRAALGKRDGGGAGGWTLVVIYESPTMSSKFISLFDGYVGVNPDAGSGQLKQVDFTVSGFQTLPAPFNVNAKIGVAALEGDNLKTGDDLQFKASSLPVATPFTIISDAVNPKSNFFNATISDNGANVTNRTPNSTNTMGFDIDHVKIPNPSNGVVPNNETGATLRLTTDGDGYGAFVTTFSVDIIEPKIVLTKEVRDKDDNDASNANVKLGDLLNYVIGFQNQGNDNATSFTITDQLPVNTIFNYPADIVSVPAGVTHTFNAATRTIIFTVPNNLVLKNGGRHTIRLKVQVVPTCASLTDACSNIIQNTAMSNYSGEYNSGVFGDKSLASFTSCNVGIPQSTNFLVGVDDCKKRNDVLCSNSLVISASGGYASYSWSTSPTGIPVIGTSQTLTVTQPGTYYVHNTASPPCVDIDEEITVAPYAGTTVNPVKPYADNKNPDGSITVCPNNGKELPKIFLCGLNDSRLINTGITGASSIVWETTTCVAPTGFSDLCANEDTGCVWTSAGPNGASFNANTAGQFRVTINYGGCFNRYYFNVYKNLLNPTETHKDMICGKDGNITINGVPAGYEYSLNKTSGYQTSNSFTITTAGTYTVYIRQTGVATNPCIFEVKDIPILKIDFPAIAPVVTHPSCYGDKGSIHVYGTPYNGAQYTYELFKNSVSVAKVVNTTASDYVFANLDSGGYVFTVTTLDGCTYTNWWTPINDSAGEIKAIPSIKTPLTSCVNGVIKINTSQDRNFSRVFYYFVNGDPAFLTSTSDGSVEIPVTASGLYTIRVVGTNNCEVTVTQQVDMLPKPTYTITPPAPINCYNEKGQITVNVTSAVGYIEYSKDNGGTFQTSPVFSNLDPGTYAIVVRYKPQASSPNSEFCSDPAQSVTITGPAAALTASSGVAELAGCTLPDASGVNQGGKLRVTNVLGGTPNYEYSFDGGMNWQTSPEADKMPGTYTIQVRDSKGCVFSMPAVTIDAKPAPPTIDVSSPVFNCNGTATSTVTVTNGASNYTYEYYINDVANTPITNPVFANVPSGPHKITVKYNVSSVTTYSNLLQEDFGKGSYTTTPGINPAYCFEDETTLHPPGFPCGDINDYQINDGKYAVASSIKTTFGGTWLVAKDHTMPSDPLGRFLCVNIGGSAGIGGILYSKPIKDVIPNQPVIISLWAENLIKKIHTGYDDPKLTIQLVNNLNGVGGAETIVATTDTANPWVVPKSDKWEYKELSLNPGAFNNLSFVIRSYNNAFNGNDVLIDDIWVRQIPKSCISQRDFDIIIDSNKAFTAQISGFKNVSCAGGNNGEITIAATNFDTTKGFQYSINNGGTWVTQMTSPVTVTGLSAATYNVLVRYDAASASTCSFPFTQNITAPSALTLSATVTKLATCTTGATITAVGGGGTPAYQYELRQGATVVTAFSNNGGIFTNVPAGSYTVFVQDANLCVIPVGFPITVAATPTLTATLAASTDYCYTTANPATLVVNVSGGLAPFTYALNGNAPINTNTFANVAPGTHTIVVTDSNNCTSTISNIIIAPQLGLKVSLLQDLTCLVNGSIGTPVITGGYGTPYAYTVSYNGGAATAVASFPYTATLAGTYAFTVTDSKGCTATSNTITVTSKTTPTITTTKTDITCNGLTNGTITVTASGGFTSAYTYAIKLSSAAAFTTQATNVFTNLAAGTYNVKVIDSKGCESAVSNVTIVNPPVVTGSIAATDIGCSPTGTVPAVVTVTASGGTGILQYSFNGNTSFSTTNTYSTATATTVTAYVKDANNCEIGPLSISIAAPETFTSISITDSGWDCSTTPAGGHVNIAGLGVSSPKRYSIISGPAGFDATENSDGEFKGLAPGAYIFQARDTKTNCTITRDYTISGAPDIVAGGSVVTPILCFGGTGTLQFTVNGAKNNGYNYVIKNAANATIQSGNNISETITTINVTAAQPAGVYTITVTDRKTQCTDDYTITLSQPSAALTITSATPTNVFCTNDNSQITVLVTGGTPNYSYAFAKSPSASPTSAYGSSTVLTVDTNAGADLLWDIYVKDANGCIAKTTVTVVSDVLPAVTAVVDNQCSASGSTFTITATGTGLAPLSYSINGGTFQSSNVFTVAAGTYTVSVQDKNGCVVSTTPITVYPQLIAAAAVTKTLDCSASPNAVITTTFSGGKSPYTYTVQKGAGAPSAATAAVSGFTYAVSNANADVYTFVITDANGCTTTTSETVTSITPPTVTATPTQVSCNGFSDGAVSLVGAGGSGGFTYSNDNITFQASGIFSGLTASATPYTFYVKDSKGCVGSTTVTITQPTALVVSASATTFTCDAANAKQSATVTIAVPTTGTAPYTYSFNGGGYTAVRTLTVNDNGTDQTINYSVKDANGCTQTGSILLLKLNSPTDLTFANSAVTCTAPTTSLTLTATNGVDTLQYETIAPSVVIVSKQTSNVFAGLTSGNYTFKVTDANGCYYTESYEIKAVIPIAIAGNVTANVDCKGNATGDASFTVSGNATVGNYTFALTAGSLGTGSLTKLNDTLTLSNVIAGTYTIEVTDTATGCKDDFSVTITEPTAALTITSAIPTNVFCTNDNSQITVLATGGTMNYSYAYAPSPSTVPTSTYSSSNVLNIDTTNGTILAWDIYVKDANGCIDKTTVTVVSDVLPTVTAVVDNQCSASGSTFTITATGTGLAPLEYGIAGPTGAFQTSPTFTVAAGTYTVSVKDKNGCIVSALVPTVVYPQLTITGSVTKTLDCNTAGPNATISATISGGKTNYSYVITNSGGTTITSGSGVTGPTITYTGAAADTYTVTVTDANTPGCTATTTITVAPITDPTVSATPTQVSCFGGANGAVSLVGAGGSGGYTYSKDNIIFQASGVFSGLTASATPYTFYVKDSKGCVGSTTVTITEPTQLAATVTEVPFSCSTTNTHVAGTVTINATAGTAPYQYRFNSGGFGASNVLTLNDNGADQSYTYEVRDANGCIISGSGTLSKLNPPAIASISGTPIYCTPLATTSDVTVSINGGTGVGAITYEITAPAASATSNTTGVFTGLAGGITYTFKVTDANGCFATQSHPVPDVTPIAVTTTKLSDVNCNGIPTGSAKFTVTGFSSSGNYAITVSSTPASLPYSKTTIGDVHTLTGLAAGTYTFSVTDNLTGCTDSENVIITEPTTLTATYTTVNANCNVPTSQVTVTPLGGTPGHTYSFNNSNITAGTFGASNVANLDPAQTWYAWVKDLNGCTTTLALTLVKDPVPTVSAVVLNQCSTGSTFQIQATGAGGIAPYTYTINTGVAPSPADTFTVAAGSYTITATDANGCPATTTVTVNLALTATAIVTKDITCSLPEEATIKVDVLGGLAPFGYRVNIGGSGYSGAVIPFPIVGTTLNYTAAGNTGTSYEFEITDANGTPCTAFTNVVNTNSTVPVTASETHVDPTCNGFTDGSIRLTATAGEAPFMFSISGAGGLVSSNVFGGLAAGSYNYIVRDAKGCDATGTIVLVNPPAIVVNIVSNPIQCNTNAPGSIDATITSGGVAPFTYTIYDNTFTQIATTGPIAAITHNFPGLIFGDYFVTIVDSKGCEFKSLKTRILTPPNIDATGLASSGTCLLGASVDINVLIGAAPFTYQIYGQPSTSVGPIPATTHTFTGLNHGVTYLFQVIDAGGCYTIVEVTTPTLSAIDIDPITTTNVTCNGGTDNGSVSFTVKNYNLSVTQLLVEVRDQLTNLPVIPVKNVTFTGVTGGDLSGTITGLKAGTYTLFAKEMDGTECNTSELFQITQPAQPLTSVIASNVNATCNSGALVTLTTIGGTGPYEYAYALAPTVPSSFALGNVLTLDYTLGTNWNITVKDSNGCTFPLSVTIAKDPTPVIDLSVVNKCVAEGAFEILVAETTAGTGAYMISVDGGTFTSIAGLPHTVSGLNSGSHTIIIKDANGCTDTKTITIDAPLVVTPAIDALPTCADNDGQITLTGTGGTGIYTYSISPVAGTVTANVISGLPAGTYTVTMTDTAIPTNCTTTAVVTLGTPTPVTFTTVTTPALCVGDSNGSITVTLLAGNNNPSYTYEIIAPITVAAQSSNVFTSLPAATYTVRVNSGRGCFTDDATVVIAPAIPLTASAAFPPNTTCSTSTVITVTAGGGNPMATGTGYLYNFNGLGYTSDNTYNVNDDGTIQTITYTVKDKNGCETAPQNVVIDPLNKPTDLDFVVSTAPTCPAPTSGITVTATNGVGALTFEIVEFNGFPTAIYPPQTTAGSAVPAVFNNLPIGTYLFQVTDANGCTYQESYTVAPVTPIAIVGTLVNDISCDAANGTTNNGSASFTVTGFSSTLNYSITVSPPVLPAQISNVADVITLTGLSAGTYIVTVTDNTTGCSEDDSVTITLPAAIAFTATPTKVFCSQDVSTITVTAVTGGTGVYSYAVVLVGGTPLAGDYSNSPTLSVDTNLTNLSWDVYVKDANGCIAMQNVNITNDAAPTIVAPAQLCYVGAPLTVDLSPNTITTTYNGTKSYTVNGSAIATSMATFNVPGTYVLGIKDDNGCEAFVNYTIEKQLLANAILTKDLYCAALVDATIDVTITDGVAPYSYQMYLGAVAVGGATPVVGSTFTASVNAPGMYSFVITDSNAAACTVTTNQVEVTTPTIPTFTEVHTNVTCDAGFDGTITITPANGVLPYTFILTGAGSNPSGDSTGIYTGLPAGSYTVVVTDAKGCTSVAAPAIVITAPAVVSATISVTTGLTCGAGNATQAATVTAQGFGGNGSYQYNFNNQGWTSNDTFVTNTSGTVSVIVKDGNGCSFATAVTTTVMSLNPPTDLTFSQTAVTCLATTSTVTITTTNGVGALTYSIISPASATGNTTGATSGIFTGLLPDTYTFQVTDANGCTYQESYTVAPVTPIAIVGTLVNDISCDAANGTTNNGSASFTVTGFSASGNYSITVTSVPLALPFTQTASGDVITLTGLSAGTYTVTVTDNTTGCSEDDSVTITLPAAIAFTATPTKVFCSQDVSTITVTAVTGGTGVYSYAVVSVGGTPLAGDYSNSPTLSVDTNLTNLSWDVYVKDANGCIAMQNVNITNDAAPTIAVPAAQCYVGAALTTDLDLVTTTYNGNKFYTVNGSAIATSMATFNVPGTYVLGIKDDNGCEDFVNYTIEKQLLANAILTKDLYCAAPVNATIDVTITDGVAPYSYQMYLGAVAVGVPTAVTGSTFTASVNAPGMYSFVITDSNAAACTVTSNVVEVTTPVNPIATYTKTDVSCINGNDGTITISSANGELPYTYTLTGVGSNTSGDSTGNYTGLPAGTYNFVVTDAKKCTFTDDVVIDNKTQVTATEVVTPFGCDAANAPQDAIVTITPAGGTPGYTFSFDGGATFQTSASFTVNSAQTINYVVRDANGCEFTDTAVVAPYTPPTDMDITATPIYCSTPGTVATVTVNSVTGGVSPFVFEIISPTATAPTAPTTAPFSFAGLAPDTYIIKVTDANGCSTTKAFVVEEADKISVTAQVINDVYCNGDSTGIIEFTVSNYITPANYSFNLVPNLGTMTQSGNVIRYTGVAAGLYTFTVTDNTSTCVASIVDFAVSEPTVLDFTTTATNINCNNDNATITVTATGGTPTYTYAAVIAGSSAPASSAYGLNNLLTIDTNSGANLTWDVYVMDANGCVTFKPETILIDANPIIASAVATQCPSATGTYDITVTASGFSATLQYSADGSNYQSGNVITVNAPGTYTITVKDANGCVSVGFPVTILDALILTPTVVTPVSCANGDGEISVSTTGGSGNYEYRIDSGSYPMTTPFTGLASGSHTIYVRDTTTGCEVSETINLQAATLITGFDLTKTEVTCNGGSDGTITAIMDTPAPGVNDNPVYTYTLSGTASRPAQTSPLFSGLAAGSYTVVVTSERNCTDTKTITIDEPLQIVVPTPTVLQFGCTSGNTGNLATITVNGVTGGSNVYLNYEFIKVGTPNTVVQFGNSNTYTEANLLGGSYIVNVYDDKGCIGTTTATIVIDPYIQLDKVNVAVTQTITCNLLENITVTATTIGGTPASLQYTLVSVDASTGTQGTLYPSQTNSTGLFTGLVVADYLITVTNPATGCSIQSIHYVNEPNTFDLTIANVVDITCFGDANGSAEVTLIDTVPLPTNEAGAFTYTVTGPVPSSGTSATAGPLALTNLAAGNYTITATLTNSPNCTVSKNFMIAAPSAALAISETHTEITCVAGNNDGSITVTATGGWAGNYEFQLERGANVVSAWSATTDYFGLVAGTYTARVRDVKGCEVFTTVLLANPTPITFTALPSATLLTCRGDADVSITVSMPTGGQGSNYFYTLNTTSATPIISSGPQTSNVFTNLGVGTYTITVTDGWGCSADSGTITITEPTEVVASLVLASSQTCLTQSTLTLSATGGTGAYEYSTSTSGTWTSMGGSSITFPVPVGAHRFYVRDANGCVSFVSNDVVIEPLPTLVVTLDVQNAKISCKGDSNGVIVATATGGLGGYVYTLLDGAGNPVAFTPVQTTPGNFTQLPAGTYQVRVDSGDCLAFSVSEVIEEPLTGLSHSVAKTDVTCNGAGNGSITVTASGGTGVIKYAIEPNLNQFFDSGVFDELKPGTYEIIVQDENGCYVILSETIREPLPIFVNTVAGSEVEELCFGDMNAAFDINIIGGVAPYSVSIDNINGTYFTGTPTQTVFSFTSLLGGDHTVFIKDANGCTAEWLVQLEPSVHLDPKAAVTYGCDNNSPSNAVTVTLDASITNLADVDYALDGSTVFQASNVFLNVAPGMHTITARHSNGCEKTTIPFEVLGFTPLALTLADGGLNEIVATATGGAGNYQYSFDGGATFTTNNKYIYYKTGDYTVIVRDANGCEATATRFFEFIDIKIPNAFTPNGDGNNDFWLPTNTVNYKDLVINIFDRYGRKIATLREGQGWDGRYNNAELPSGDYWYIMKLKNAQDGREFVGHVTLIR